LEDFCVSTNYQFDLGCADGFGGRCLFAAFGDAVATFALSKPHRSFCFCRDRLAGHALKALFASYRHVTAMWFMVGAQAAFVGVLIASLFGVLHWLVSGLSVIILLYAILSWIQPNSGSMMLLSRIVAPWLAPIRNAIPQPGGIDLSPLVLLLILQIVGMVLAGLQHGGF
jgi:uncharacterized protein YggT (Ycf19 family)